MRIISKNSTDRYIFTDVNQVEGMETIYLDITDLDAIRKINEALAGRIVERSDNFCYQIKPDPNRNYRYKRKPSEND
jgi:hypothetical protein